MSAALEPAASPFSARYRVLSVGVFALVLGIAFEFMAVATALPVAAEELGGLGLFPWALTGFLGAAMFANGVAGEACDRFGPRMPLVAGSATFTAGLVASGTAQTMPLLIAGRVVQGLGAGFIIVAVYVIIGQCYPEELRPKAMSFIATAWVVPSVVGPFIAGWLTEAISWRWAFLSLVPLIPIPLAVVMPKLVTTTASEVRREGTVRLAAVMAAGAALLQWAALESENAHWWTAGVAAVVGAGLVVFAASRLFPAGTLRLRRGLPSVIAFRGVIAGGFFGCQAYVPLMLVQHRGATPTWAGLAVAGTAIGWSAGAAWQGRPRSGADRSVLVRRGALVTVVGVVVTATAAIKTDGLVVPAWTSGIGLVIGGLGMGLSMASNSVLLLTYSEPEEQGANSAALQMSDALGGLLVIGLIGVVYALWRESADASALYSTMFAMSLAVTALAAFVATRVRRDPSVAPPGPAVGSLVSEADDLAGA